MAEVLVIRSEDIVETQNEDKKKSSVVVRILLFALVVLTILTPSIILTTIQLGQVSDARADLTALSEEDIEGYAITHRAVATVTMVEQTNKGYFAKCGDVDASVEITKSEFDAFQDGEIVNLAYTVKEYFIPEYVYKTNTIFFSLRVGDSAEYSSSPKNRVFAYRYVDGVSIDNAVEQDIRDFISEQESLIPLWNSNALTSIWVLFPILTGVVLAMMIFVLREARK